MDTAKVIITAASILVGLLMLNAFNNKKNQRHKQGLMPAVAAVYGVLATVVVILKIEDIKQVYDLQEQAQYIEIWLINMMVFWIFLLVKLIARPIVNKLSQASIAYGLITTFYEYDADYNEWFLQERWCNIRKLFKQFLGVYAGFAALFLALTWINGEGSRFWVHITPVVLLLVVFEIYSFLDSYTKVEWEHNVMGDESISERVSNFYRIRDIYERLFPAEILAANTGCEFTEQKDVISLLKQMEESEDDMEVLTSEFFSMNEGEEYYDADYIQAVVKLMKKENVIFFNPFYRDLGKYIILPFINALISDQNCLIMLGRGSTKEDVKVWIEELIKDYCKFDSIWRIGEINREGEGCEIGLLSFSDLYDYRVIEENKEFFEKAGFVFILEPSLVINTGQIGFSIIADQMRESGLDPVYCIADRMVDGLVDTMSHLLREKITDVIAPPVPRHIYTSMAWDVDGDYMRQRLFEKQTRYLGNGFELSAVAVKNQIPEVTWVSETKAPISDLKWIIGQYYTTLCKYMNLPIQQQSIYDKIKFVSNLWSVDRVKERFLVVDDEFCNIFGMMRVFMSRAEQQIFVNVMSENYLLRDYMRCNAQIFTSNPNVVPSIVPDYAKTERNTILKLLLMMAYKPVSEEDIRKDLELINYPGEDVFLSLNNLVEKYTFVKEPIFSIHTEKNAEDLTNLGSEFFYRVEPAIFAKYLEKTLKNAYYIVEQEDKEVEYIDAKLYGQVVQTVLPGQSVIYDGKYYTVKHLSVNNGVILRRSADIYDGRKYYRQMRKYYLDESPDAKIISHKKIMDVELSMLCTDFHVETTGYLEMGTNNDLRNAREIDLQYDVAYEELQRRYKNKNILRIKLPDTTKHQKFTVCLLMMEMFRSIFPNTWHYLAVTTVRPDDVAGMLNYAVYELHGNVDEDYIYVIEDSDMDLGLLEAVEKNFNKFMEIMADFIVWHFEKMREPEYKDPVRKNIVMPEDQKVKRGLPKLLERIAKIFGVKKEKEVKIEEPVEDTPTEETPVTETPVEETPVAETPAEKAPEAEISVEEQAGEEQSGEESYTLDDPEKETSEGSEAEVKEDVLEDAAKEGAEESEENPEDYTLDAEPAEESTEKPAEEPAEAVQPAAKTEIAEEAEKIVSHVDESEVPEVEDAQSEDFDDIFDDEKEKDSDVVDIDGTDIFDTDSDPEHDDYFEEHFKALGIDGEAKTRYQQECYLKYGFDEIDGRIDLDAIRKYLNARGWTNKDLTKARMRDTFVDMALYFEAENHCDFCGVPISGVSYERVNDGRIRCNDCSASAINSADEFRKLFYHILSTMQNFYGIDYRVPISVKMTDAREIGRGAGMIFRPSTEYAARVLGYAQRKHGKYNLLVENGAPRLAMINTMVHEMTHIWQYLNWKDSDIAKLYGTGTNRDIVYEGMAMWAAIQYLYMIGETSYAAKQELIASRREDVYGVGFNLFCQKYPMVKDSSTIKYSPFGVFPPL